MKTLRQIAEDCETNKLHHGYEPFYEALLGHLRDDPIKLLEIGIWRGASLRMWRDYFPRAQVYGFDNYDGFLFEEDRITTMLVDQSDRAQLATAMETIGQVDVILDDGSHNVIHQQISLGFLFRYLNSGGIYIIEDVHSSYFYAGYDSAAHDAELMGFSRDMYNTTYVMLKNYEQFGQMRSQYMTAAELKYLNGHIAYFDLNIRNNFAAVFCAIQLT